MPVSVLEMETGIVLMAVFSPGDVSLMFNPRRGLGGYNKWEHPLNQQRHVPHTPTPWLTVTVTNVNRY